MITLAIKVLFSTIVVTFLSTRNSTKRT